jgi:hypothetical protein
MLTSTASVATTSRSRIVQLESEVSELWSAMRSLQDQLGRANSSDIKRSKEAGESESSPVNPPTHLLQLFDNGLLDSRGCETAAASPLPPHKADKSDSLRRLMPSRRDMVKITTHAAPWLSLHNAIFPMANLMKNSDEMLQRYDELQGPGADLIGVAALLICIAITVHQSPEETAGAEAETIKDATAFVDEISNSIERVIISDDSISATVEGIEITLLFIRLQMGRAKMRKVWLLKNRAIALGELIGLPPTSTNTAASRKQELGDVAASPTNKSQKLRDETWGSICAVDRIMSIMWSLPLATSNFSLPKRPAFNDQGQLNAQAYLYRMADIASRVLELDNMYASGKPLAELVGPVMETDKELRLLAGLAPKGWHKIYWPQLSIDPILQYWHQYLTARTHLQLALKYYEGQEFAFNFVACLDACQELVKRYTSMRLLLPPGFFANQVMDLQAFTGTIFLLLAGYRNTRGSGASLLTVDVDVTSNLVDQAVRTMDFAADQVAGDFARQAAVGVRSLNTLLQQQQVGEPQQITLNLALVGRIHVSRKPSTKAIPNTSYPGPAQPPDASWQTTALNEESAPAAQMMPFRASEGDLMDSLSYSMEIQENLPFLMDDTEQWLTWTGLAQ